MASFRLEESLKNILEGVCMTAATAIFATAFRLLL
jgi:hypothetical protein